MNDFERQVWYLDQAINARGLPIDRAVVDGAVKINRAEKSRIRHEMNLLTGLANANSGAQLIPWVQSHGIGVPTKYSKAAEKQAPTLDKEAVAQLLEGDLPSDTVRQVLLMRQKVNQTSTEKWVSLQRGIMDDDRLRGTLAMYGAQRTWRWAGRIFQPHNIKQGYENADELVEVLATGDVALVRLIHGEVLDFLSNTVRAAVTAPAGRLLVVNDYGSIESRMLGYLSGCVRINQLFAEGLDTYKDMATVIFGILYEQVTKAQRKFSKPPVLGCGYQLGGPGLVKYADGMGVTLEEDESQRIVNLYRETYPEVPEMWYWLNDNCKAVTNREISSAEGFGVAIYRDEQFLFIRLPSGRNISYYHPLVQTLEAPWSTPEKPQYIQQFTYMGMDQYTHKWSRISTHGGKITENIVQALSRDLLAYHMVQMDPQLQGFLIGHVHDEPIAESPEDRAEDDFALMTEIMSTPPPWAPTLKLATGGFISKRYKKD